MTVRRLDKVLERVSDLPFSPVAAKIMELARDDRAGAQQIARIVEQDQAFTARLLKIANSAYYGQSRAVITVTQAVPVLGVNMISSLAMALLNFTVSSRYESSALTLQDLWEHSLGCAHWSKQLAHKLRQPNEEQAFIAGLLHDMGKAIFYRFFNREFLEAIELAQTRGLDLIDAERLVLNTDHAAAGTLVAQKWHLPPLLLQVLEFHHDPNGLGSAVDPLTRRTTAIVHLADLLCEHYRIGFALESQIANSHDELLRDLGLDREICQSLLPAVQREVDAFRELCGLPRLPDKKPTDAFQPKARTGENSSGSALTPPDTTLAPAKSVRQIDDRGARIMEAVKHMALLAGVDDLGPLIATQAMQLLNADAAEMFTVADDVLIVAGVAGIPALTDRQFPIKPSLAGWVLRTGEPMVVPNIFKAAQSWEKEFFCQAGYESHLLVPVDWADKRSAVLAVNARSKRDWSSADISSIQTFAGFIAVALVNANLYREAEERAKLLETLNRDLRDALHVKNRFLATVSHELRTPLHIITGYMNLIREQAYGAIPAPMAEAVERVAKQSDAFTRLISYIIELSRLEAHSLQVERRPVALAAILQRSAAMMPGRIGGKPIEFVYDCPVDDILVATDPERFAEVLDHLLDNAAKFTHQGHIILRARSASDSIEITIADTGIGIDLANHEVVFEAFRQIDCEDDRRFEGLGVGLYLVRRLIELLGGRIELDSTVGSGTIFRLHLPSMLPAEVGERSMDLR